MYFVVMFVTTESRWTSAHHTCHQTSVEVSGEGDCMYRQNPPPLCGNIEVLKHCRRLQFHRLGPFHKHRCRRFQSPVAGPFDVLFRRCFWLDHRCNFLDLLLQHDP